MKDFINEIIENPITIALTIDGKECDFESVGEVKEMLQEDIAVIPMVHKEYEKELAWAFVDVCTETKNWHYYEITYNKI